MSQEQQQTDCIRDVVAFIDGSETPDIISTFERILMFTYPALSQEQIQTILAEVRSER
jgi:hypothetical protein